MTFGSRLSAGADSRYRPAIILTLCRLSALGWIAGVPREEIYRPILPSVVFWWLSTPPPPMPSLLKVARPHFAYHADFLGIVYNSDFQVIHSIGYTVESGDIIHGLYHPALLLYRPLPEVREAILARLEPHKRPKLQVWQPQPHLFANISDCASWHKSMQCSRATQHHRIWLFSQYSWHLEDHLGPTGLIIQPLISVTLVRSEVGWYNRILQYLEPIGPFLLGGQFSRGKTKREGCKKKDHRLSFLFVICFGPPPPNWTSGIEPDEHFFRKLLDGYRMEVPAGAPGPVGVLMNRCWNADAKHRPTFAQLEGARSWHFLFLGSAVVFTVAGRLLQWRWPASWTNRCGVVTRKRIRRRSSRSTSTNGRPPPTSTFRSSEFHDNSPQIHSFLLWFQVLRMLGGWRFLFRIFLLHVTIFSGVFLV